MVNRVLSDIKKYFGIGMCTNIAALKGGSSEAVTRWAVTEVDPALWPQLYRMCKLSDLGWLSTGNSHSDLVRITAEFGNVSLNPGQEEIFWRIPNHQHSDRNNRTKAASETMKAYWSPNQYSRSYNPTLVVPLARTSFPPRKPKAFTR